MRYKLKFLLLDVLSFFHPLFFFFTFFVFACADALLGGVPKLWDYYVAGLKAKNDLALSIFAPPLVWAKAHAAFAPSQPIFIPGNYV